MSIRPLLSFLALIAAAASAAPGRQVSPSDAAKAFTLDGIAPSPSPTPVAPATSAVPDPVAPAAPALAAPAVRAVFTLDTPIQDLIADPGARRVLDKDLPGMSDDENLDKFKMLSLRALQPQTGGQLTEAMLMKVASDLDVLGGGSGALTMPAPAPKAGSSKRNQDSSR